MCTSLGGRRYLSWSTDHSASQFTESYAFLRSTKQRKSGLWNSRGRSINIRSENNWSAQPLPFRKPHWFSLSIWLAFSFKLHWMTLQNSLPGTLSRAMPLKLSQSSYAPFLCKGMTSCFRQSLGTSSECHILCDSRVSHLTMGSPQASTSLL